MRMQNNALVHMRHHAPTTRFKRLQHVLHKSLIHHMALGAQCRIRILQQPCRCKCGIRLHLGGLVGIKHMHACVLTCTQTSDTVPGYEESSEGSEMAALAVR
eukprot:365325-Chlamydomonas_euryale.AAC.21